MPQASHSFANIGWLHFDKQQPIFWQGNNIRFLPRLSSPPLPGPLPDQSHSLGGTFPRARVPLPSHLLPCDHVPSSRLGMNINLYSCINLLLGLSKLTFLVRHQTHGPHGPFPRTEWEILRGKVRSKPSGPPNSSSASFTIFPSDLNKIGSCFLRIWMLTDPPSLRGQQRAH